MVAPWRVRACSAACSPPTLLRSSIASLPSARLSTLPDHSVARYVRQPVETTAVDLSAAAAELAEVEQLRADAEKRMDQAVAALGQLLGAS